MLGRQGVVGCVSLVPAPAASKQEAPQLHNSPHQQLTHLSTRPTSATDPAGVTQQGPPSRDHPAHLIDEQHTRHQLRHALVDVAVDHLHTKDGGREGGKPLSSGRL